MKLMQKILPSFVSIDYQDDINIISKSPADFQASLDYLIPLLEKCGLKVNALKSSAFLLFIQI